jgi:Holliday junction resolvase RusA-like endonuclease
MRVFEFNINPVSKPRMVRSDKWKTRTITDSYWAFKDELKLNANKQGLSTLPEAIMGITFIVPMPESWSKTKKTTHEGKPHRQRPDLDNFLKGLQDCLCKEDSHIWYIGNLRKVWGTEGKIIITI